MKQVFAINLVTAEKIIQKQVPYTSIGDDLAETGTAFIANKILCVAFSLFVP